MRLVYFFKYFAAAGLILLGISGCSSGLDPDASDAFSDDAIYKEPDIVESVPDTSPEPEVFESYYKMTVTLPHGAEIVFNRDLSGSDEFFSFGSTHIAPAISFAMTETLYNADPQVSFAIVHMNFGIIQGSDQFPIQTPGVGDYDFSAIPPGIDVTLDGTEYSSSIEGASGTIVVDQWNKVAGGIFSGSFSGTLIEDSVKDPSPEIEVEGTYYFELPPTRY